MNFFEQKQAARKARLESRAARKVNESAALYDRAKEMASIIPFGQPVLLGHYSEKRDRNYRAKIGRTYAKAFDAGKEARELLARADAVGSGGISSDDPDAVLKLRSHLEELELRQAHMVSANKAARRAKTARPFECFQLTNNGANIRRIKWRIATLEQSAARETKEIAHASGARIIENVEANRVQIFFADKPPAEMRDKLKKHGFRWSPNAGAWQRHLNNAARHAVNCVLSDRP